MDDMRQEHGMSEVRTLTLTEFLTARLDEDEAVARAAGLGSWEAGERCVWRASPIQVLEVVTDDRDGENGCETPEIAEHIARHDPARVLAEVEAKRRIIDFHKNWPVLVESPPEFTHDTDDPAGMTVRMSKQIAWTTEQRYRETFGTEPPTGPILRALALPYADHPDFNPDWRP